MTEVKLQVKHNNHTYLVVRRAQAGQSRVEVYMGDAFLFDHDKPLSNVDVRQMIDSFWQGYHLGQTGELMASVLT